MTASMQLAGFELLHNPSSLTGYAPANGAPIYALLDGWDLGAPAPRVASTASAYVDGSRMYGRRSDNREFKLPVAVAVTVADGRTALASAVEALLTAVDQPAYILQWTPDGGLANRFDLFRATITHEYDLTLEQAAQAFSVPCYARAFTVTAEALPFASETVPSPITLPTAFLTLGSAPVRAAAYLLPRDNTGYPGTASTPLFGSLVYSATPPANGGNVLIHSAPIDGGGPPAVPFAPQSSINGGGTTASRFVYGGQTAAVAHSGTYEVIMVLPSAAFADANLANYVFTPAMAAFSPTRGGTVTGQATTGVALVGPLYEFISLGYLQLPAMDWPADRSAADAAFFSRVDITITLSGSTVTPTWAAGGLPDVLLLDTRGQTFIRGGSSVASQETIWIDEPVIPYEVQGKVLVSAASGTNSPHAKAGGVFQNQLFLAGGAPLLLDPDPRGNVVLVYCSAGQPTMAFQRRDRWQNERAF